MLCGSQQSPRIGIIANGIRYVELLTLHRDSSRKVAAQHHDAGIAKVDVDMPVMASTTLLANLVHELDMN